MCVFHPINDRSFRSIISRLFVSVNNLALTGTERPVAPATPPVVTVHPLLGRMDISAYTPPPEGTVQTFTGHSKVSLHLTLWT